VPAPRQPGADRAVVLRGARVALGVIVLVIVGTAAVAVLESIVGVSDASPVYLVAVVASGVLFGTTPAIATALTSVLVYDFLFTEPRYTLSVAQPRDWLDLLLFLFVAIAVGRLAALQRERADEADRRARESLASFSISRILATAPDLEAAATAIVDLLLQSTHMRPVWIGIDTGGRERILAGDPAPSDGPAPATTSTLARRPGDEPARWVRTHVPRVPVERAPGSSDVQLRVKLESEGQVLGSLWARRPREAGEATPEETRLLALAADQLALALRRQVLAREAMTAEVARQSDLLKSALLDSVSHDLRTPLASIRAAAGSLMDPAVEVSPSDRIATASSIDVEAQRLGRFVREMLDLSRIDAGALRPDVQALDVAGTVEPIVARLGPQLDGRPVDLDLPPDLPPVRADAVFVDEIVGNLLDNAIRYAPPPAAIRISARCVGNDVEVAVEDGGPGVPADLMPRLFDRFYRVERPREGARRGIGLGLAVVRGLAGAMGGTVEATASELGGLRVSIRLPAETLGREMEGS
jgi:two-component system, OmpR family, sensor histidine kinase KdpD